MRSSTRPVERTTAKSHLAFRPDVVALNRPSADQFAQQEDHMVLVRKWLGLWTDALSLRFVRI